MCWISLSIVMPLSRNARGPHLACTTRGSPHRHFPNWNPCGHQTGPCCSYHDCKMHLSNNHQRTLTNKFYYHSLWRRVDGTPGPHSKVAAQVKRQRRPGVLLLLGPRVGCLVVSVFIILVNLKHERGN